MIRIGEWNDLVIKRERDFGVYVGSADDDREVLLPRKQVPNGAKIGEHINVFVYRDSDDRIIATVKVPYITMGKMAVLRCVGTTKIGAFMDWGLEKDILLPFKEQSGPVREGREYLVRMYTDKSDRLCVSMKVYEYLSCESPYKQGDEISGIVIEYKSEYGAFVAVDNKYAALVPGKEIHSAIYPGDKIQGRVADVREDGKLNLTLQKPAKIQTRENAEMIVNIIESYNGVLPFNDKADTSVIEKEFANLTGNEAVWDLYCGIGTISLFLAKNAGMVYGVEIVPQAIEDAKNNAGLNGIDNAEFFVGKAEEVVTAFYESRKADDGTGHNMTRPDVIVVDPPRKGCDEKLLDTIVTMSPQRVVYVSCDSATLARDLKVLSERGYKIVKVQPVDQFGNTVHVETVVLLSQLKQKPDDYIDVTIELDDVDITSAETKATAVSKR